MEETKTAVGGMALAAPLGRLRYSRKTRSSASTPAHEAGNATATPRSNSPDNAKSIGGESGAATPSDSTSLPPLARKASNKAAAPEPVLYTHLPDVKEEATADFQMITDCLYGSKNLGSTDNDALDCECREEWHHGVNGACGEDDSCINRATKMECLLGGPGNCANGCRNQRFQRKQYADVSVIKTDRKGFGLRSDVDLQPGDFVYEYIGEVINEATFRRRMLQYDREGIKHFYFMSLSRNEFVDATKKGSLGRFCNHSCRPNCYVDKWVVGDKLRMGIFAKNRIRSGEELVFNYNVDRYGADAQPCFCGEPNCVGFIGGKTQSGPTTKLSVATMEALGISDTDDEPPKKARRKKADEDDDEEYVSSIQVRGLGKDDSRKVMASLVQCKERWIAVKLLERIQRCDEEKVLLYVMHMHAYDILRSALNTFSGEDHIVLQILDILYKFPRITRNKIQDSHIEPHIQALTASDNKQIAADAARLLGEWAKLEVAYRIKRRKLDPNATNATVTNSFQEGRRNVDRDRDRDEDRATPSKTASPVLDAPRGPRSQQPQRNPNLNAGYGGHHGHAHGHGHGHGLDRERDRDRNHHHNHNHNHNHNRGHHHNQNHNHGHHHHHHHHHDRDSKHQVRELQDKWYLARDPTGRVYYYNGEGKATWHPPQHPATVQSLPRPAPKAVREEKPYQGVAAAATDEEPGSTPTEADSVPEQSKPAEKPPREERWKTLPIEKQMKLYENTVAPHVMQVSCRYRDSFPKEDLKRLARDASKSLVNSDYKHNRVDDPTAPLSDRTLRKLKEFLKEYFERAVVKWKSRMKQKERLPDTPQRDDRATTPSLDTPVKSEDADADADADKDAVMFDGRDGSPTDSVDRKRKREDKVGEGSPALTPADMPGSKRLRENGDERATPPPPPPPPVDAPTPAEGRLVLREQEEALIRENEEAQRLEDEAAAAEKKKQSGEMMAGYAANCHNFQNLAINGRIALMNGSTGEMDMTLAGGQNATGDCEAKLPQKQSVMSH